MSDADDVTNLKIHVVNCIRYLFVYFERQIPLHIQIKLDGDMQAINGTYNI